MANPVLSHLISGTVKDIYETKLAGATVSLKHTLQDQTLSSVLTGSDGKYVINLSGLDSQWSKGEEIQVTASKSAEGTKTITTTIKGQGGQTVNITLAETSDFNFAENTFDKHNLFGVIPLHYDKEKVTRERGLPVHTVLERQYTQVFAKKSGTQQVEYQGWANPGSSKSDAVWRIRKLLYDGTFTTDIVWAGGNQNFEHKWSNRTSLDYS